MFGKGYPCHVCVRHLDLVTVIDLLTQHLTPLLPCALLLITEDLPGDDFVPVMGGPPTIMPDLGRGAGRGFRPGPRPLAPGGRGAALVRPLGRGQNKWVRPGAAVAADAADVGEAAGEDRPIKVGALL